VLSGRLLGKDHARFYCLYGTSRNVVDLGGLIRPKLLRRLQWRGLGRKHVRGRVHGRRSSRKRHLRRGKSGCVRLLGWSGGVEPVGHNPADRQRGSDATAPSARDRGQHGWVRWRSSRWRSGGSTRSRRRPKRPERCSGRASGPDRSGERPRRRRHGPSTLAPPGRTDAQERTDRPDGHAEHLRGLRRRYQAHRQKRGSGCGRRAGAPSAVIKLGPRGRAWDRESSSGRAVERSDRDPAQAARSSFG
jgi:hypothetical protein